MVVLISEFILGSTAVLLFSIQWKVSVSVQPCVQPHCSSSSLQFSPFSQGHVSAGGKESIHCDPDWSCCLSIKTSAHFLWRIRLQKHVTLKWDSQLCYHTKIWRTATMSLLYCVCIMAYLLACTSVFYSPVICALKQHSRITRRPFLFFQLLPLEVATANHLHASHLVAGICHTSPLHALHYTHKSSLCSWSFSSCLAAPSSAAFVQDIHLTSSAQLRLASPTLSANHSTSFLILSLQTQNYFILLKSTANTDYRGFWAVFRVNLTFF